MAEFLNLPTKEQFDVQNATNISINTGNRRNCN